VLATVLWESVASETEPDVRSSVHGALASVGAVFEDVLRGMTPAGMPCGSVMTEAARTALAGLRNRLANLVIPPVPVHTDGQGLSATINFFFFGKLTFFFFFRNP
jgi:hypothetical protein